MSINREAEGAIIAEAIIRVVKGDDIETVSKESGLAPETLNAALEEFRALHGQEFLKEAVAASGTGRNEPCPCGSEKKYKRCCEPLHRGVMKLMGPDAVKAASEAELQKRWLNERLQQAYSLLARGEDDKTLDAARELLGRAPHNDRLHDLVYNVELNRGRFRDAVEMARARFWVAGEEMNHFLETKEHRLESQDPLAHLYHPHVWLRKVFIAEKARENEENIPEPPDAELKELADKLLLANDMKRFPERGEEGLAARRKGLKKVISRLKEEPDALPYMLRFCHIFSWAAALVPEILAAHNTPASVDAILDIAVFDYPFVSDECQNILAQMGDEGLRAVKAALAEETEYDPIKIPLIGVLGKIKTPGSMDFLRILLNRASPHVVNEAGLAMAEHGDPSVIPELKEANERIGQQMGLDMAIQWLEDLSSGKEGKEDQGAD